MSDHRREIKKGELRIGGGKTLLSPTNENLPARVLRGLERGPNRGAKSRLPKGDGSYSSVDSATACLRARSFFGTCCFSVAVIGAVSVRIKHSSVDAGTPLHRLFKHHCFRNAVLMGI